MTITQDPDEFLARKGQNFTMANANGLLTLGQELHCIKRPSYKEVPIVVGVRLEPRSQTYLLGRLTDADLVKGGIGV